MRKLELFIAIGSLGLVAACGGGDKAKMKKFTDRMCDCVKDTKDPPGCAENVDTEYERWSKQMAEKYKDEAPEEMDKDLTQMAKDYGACEMKAKLAVGAGSGGDAGVGSAAASGGGGERTGVKECDDYLSAMERYLSCDKVPQAARDAMKAGMDQQRAGFKAAGAAAADGCKQSADALAKTTAASGC